MSQPRHMERAWPPARTKRPPRSSSDTSLDTGDSSAAAADPAGRRPFLRVFTHGIPRMLRRGPQQASPLQTPGPAASGSRFSGLAAAISRAGGASKTSDSYEMLSAHSTPLPALVPDGMARDGLAATGPAASSASAFDVMATADSGACAEDPQVEVGAQQAALAEGAGNRATPKMQSPAAGSRLPTPQSDADQLGLSPEVHMKQQSGATGAAVSDATMVRSNPCLCTAAQELDVSPESIEASANADVSASGALSAPMVRSDPCLSTAARELDLSQEALTANSSVHSPVDTLVSAAPGLQTVDAPADGDAIGAPIAGGSGVQMDDVAVDRPGSTAAVQSGEHTTEPATHSTHLAQQSSQQSRASHPAAAEQHCPSRAPARGGSMRHAEVSDADVSDGVAVLSDARMSDSMATPDSSADEGAVADVDTTGSPEATVCDTWCAMKAAAEVADPSISSNVVELHSCTAAVGGAGGSCAESPECDRAQSARPGSMRHHEVKEGRLEGGAVGESVRQLQRASVHGISDEDTATCSDDVRSVMSTVGAPSELDSAVPGTPGAPSPGRLQDVLVSEVSPVVADMMHQDPAQAALLQLHMLGKSKKIKKGSYVISSDGAVTRTRTRPS